ncbi:hypothetical protein JCM3774_003793 [Rhodotorula dairenensis]
MVDRHPARPLHSFPAQPPPHPVRAGPRLPAPRPVRSACVRIVYLVPLVFIFSLIAFASYTFLYTLCYVYLAQARNRVLKPTLYALAFLFLDFGCAANFWMAYHRGTAGFVPAPHLQDPEASVGLAGSAAASHLASFVRTLPAIQLEHQDDDDRESDDQEETALLRATTTAAADSDSRETKSRPGPPPTALGHGGPAAGSRAPLQVKSDGSARFCRKCNAPKPDRAHHCSACRRCVLKMDHHCPWLGGGCVGWANYKFFLLALLYTGALGVFTAGVLFHELADYVYRIDDGFESAPILWAIAGLLGCIFGVAVGSFGLYHFYLACNNRTTIEAMEHPTAVAPPPPPPPPAPAHLNGGETSHQPSDAHHPPPPGLGHRQRLQSSDLTYKQRQRLASAARKYNVYDLGSCARNLEQVFGGRDKWTEWVMPWGWPPGDGHSFPVNAENIENLRLAIEAVYAEAEADFDLARERQRQRQRQDDGSATSSRFLSTRATRSAAQIPEDDDNDRWGGALWSNTSPLDLERGRGEGGRTFSDDDASTAPSSPLSDEDGPIRRA